MRLAEPMTVLTDYVLAAEGFVLGVRLLVLAARERQRAARLWGAAFVAVGVAALTGGTLHGFAPHLSAGAEAGLWLATYYAIGLANLFYLAGGVAAVVEPGPLRRGLEAAVLVRFVAYAAFLTAHRDFRYVLYDFGVTLAALIVLAMHPRVPRRGREGLVFGVLASLAGAVVQRSGLALHPDFNHNDLFHVVQMVGLYFFYRAGRVLEDAPPAASLVSSEEWRR